MSQEYRGQVEVDGGLQQRRLPHLDYDSRLFPLHAGLALVVAAVYVRLGAFFFRTKVVGQQLQRSVSEMLSIGILTSEINPVQSFGKGIMLCIQKPLKLDN